MDDQKTGHNLATAGCGCKEMFREVTVWLEMLAALVAVAGDIRAYNRQTLLVRPLAAGLLLDRACWSAGVGEGDERRRDGGGISGDGASVAVGAAGFE